MTFLTTVIILSLLVVYVIYRAVAIVPQADVWVIERLGRYHRTLDGGLHFILPFIDVIREKYTTQEQMIDVPAQAVITQDNVNITIDAIAFIIINDAKKATYGVQGIKSAVAQLAETTLRSEVGCRDLDANLSSRRELNSVLLEALDEASAPWGVKVTRIEVREIKVPKEVEESMTKVMSAERERRATETRATGDKNAMIAAAEGQLQEAKLQAQAIERTAEALRYEKVQLAEGEREAMRNINEALSENIQAAEFLLAQDRIKAFAKLAESDSANKIVVPVESKEMVGSLTAVLGLAGVNALNGNNSTNKE